MLELNTGGDFDNAISGSGGGEIPTMRRSHSFGNSYRKGGFISGGTLVATSVERWKWRHADSAVLETELRRHWAMPSAAAAVVKSGDKTLTLSGANSYTGGIP